MPPDTIVIQNVSSVDACLDIRKPTHIHVARRGKAPRVHHRHIEWPNREVWSTAFSLHTERKVFPSSVVLYNHLAKCAQHRQWVLRKHAVESLVFRKVRQIPTHVRRIVAVLGPAMYALIINCNPIMAAGKFEYRRIPHSSHTVFAEEPLEHKYRVPYLDIACPGVLNAAYFRIRGFHDTINQSPT